MWITCLVYTCHSLVEISLSYNHFLSYYNLYPPHHVEHYLHHVEPRIDSKVKMLFLLKLFFLDIYLLICPHFLPSDNSENFNNFLMLICFLKFLKTMYLYVIIIHILYLVLEIWPLFPPLPALGSGAL